MLRDAVKATVLQLLNEHRISAAEATRDLGLTRIQFVQLTRQRGISLYDYTAEHLTAEIAELAQVFR